MVAAVGARGGLVDDLRGQGGLAADGRLGRRLVQRHARQRPAAGAGRAGLVQRRAVEGVVVADAVGILIRRGGRGRGVGGAALLHQGGVADVGVDAGVAPRAVGALDVRLRGAADHVLLVGGGASRVRLPDHAGEGETAVGVAPLLRELGVGIGLLRPRLRAVLREGRGGGLPGGQGVLDRAAARLPGVHGDGRGAAALAGSRCRR